MTPQEAFWNSWFGMSLIGIVGVAALAIGFLLYSFMRPRLRVSVDWTSPKPRSVR